MAKYAGRKLVLRAAGADITGLTSVASTDVITKTAHGLLAGDVVYFKSLTGGAGLTVDTRYIVRSTGLTANDFTVATVANGAGGATVDHTTNITAGTIVKMSVVGAVTALGNVGSSRDLIDASAYGDDWKDYVVGQQDGNEVEVEIAYDPTDTGHIALKSGYDAGTVRQFEVQHLENSFYVRFTGYVTKLERGGDKDGLFVMAATLKILNPGVVDIV